MRNVANVALHHYNVLLIYILFYFIIILFKVTRKWYLCVLCILWQTNKQKHIQVNQA